MPLARPVVFPLLPMTPTGACTCAKGAACARPGHHPAVEWRDVAYGSAVPRPAPGAGYGVKTGAAPKGSGVVVIDLDGEQAVEKWLELGGGPDTYTVRSSRGLHLYFQHPGFHVPNSVGTPTTGLGPKIDVRGDGGYVVGPGSPHRSGAIYAVVDDREPAPMPAWLLAWFQAQPVRAEVQPHPDDVSGPERARRRDIYANWLSSEADPCVAGQGGDQQLFKVVQYGAYDLALPSEDVLELIAEHYDERCQPPWGDLLEERVLHKAHSAKTTSTRARNPPLLADEEEGLAVLYSAAGEMPLERTALVEPKEPPAPDNDFGFKVQWGGWDNEPVPPDYLVHNLLVEEKVTMVFAEPGTIKTWLAIELAGCVSAGLPFLGEHHVSQTPSLYVDFEDGRYEFHRRVHMLTGGESRPDLGYVYAPGNIVDQDWWIRLEKLVLSRGIKFVVIDTLAGATPGIDENDRNAADPLTYAGRLTETAKVTILFLHHANRAGDIRGTSAFKATVDTLFKLETVEDDPDSGVHRAKLTCVKSGQKKVPPIWLELTDDGLRKSEAPEKESKAGEGKEGDEPEQKRSLDEIQAELLLVVEAEGPFASIEKLKERLKTRKSTITALMSELTEAGAVYKGPEGWARDSEEQRYQRVRRAIERNPECGRNKLTVEAFVTKEFFDRCRREGRIRPAIVGDEQSGFVWVDL